MKFWGVTLLTLFFIASCGQNPTENGNTRESGEVRAHSKATSKTETCQTNSTPPMDSGTCPPQDPSGSPLNYPAQPDCLASPSCPSGYALPCQYLDGTQTPVCSA
jgi:hypothetical protein